MVKIYLLPSDRMEVHMIGDYVGVCWTTRRINRQIIGEDGLTYNAFTQERMSDPYISFIDVRQDSRTKEYYRDEDSPVAGGITANTAKIVADELLLAVEYMKEHHND